MRNQLKSNKILMQNYKFWRKLNLMCVNNTSDLLLKEKDIQHTNKTCNRCATLRPGLS